MIQKKLISTKDMCNENTIAVKVELQKRLFNQTLGGIIEKIIRRTKYLKICWMCGSAYESFKSHSYSCSTRCSNNILYKRKMGFDPPARMVQLTKEKNIKDIKERLGYR